MWAGSDPTQPVWAGRAPTQPAWARSHPTQPAGAKQEAWISPDNVHEKSLVWGNKEATIGL